MKLALVILLAIIIAGCGGYGSSSNSMAPPAPAATPMLTQLTPNNANSGGQSFPFEVDGSSFASNAVINFNGTKETTTFVSSGKLTTTIPAAAITTSGKVPVTVTNPGTPGGPYGGGTTAVTSTAMTFTIN